MLEGIGGWYGVTLRSGGWDGWKVRSNIKKCWRGWLEGIEQLE